MSLDSVTKDTIKKTSCFTNLKHKSHKKLQQLHKGNEFFLYVEIDKTVPTSSRLYDTEIVEQFLSLEVCSTLAYEDEDVDKDQCLQRAIYSTQCC